ncbi:MAG TPA: chemotaxis protein CheW [Candidatus Acidoferrales bacterium]|nr:chemotaxis protein CheW [Candidatus Acidoferrales bacterium]
MRIAVQEPLLPRTARKPEQAIVFSVAGQDFAIAAESVQEIRSADSLASTAIELDCVTLPKVRHTVERAHHTYYVVNAGVHFSLPVSRPTLVLIMRQLRVAVLVDRIERMGEISGVYALPRAFAGDERQWYRGLAYLDDHVIPVVRPSGFLTAEEFQLLDRASRSSAAAQEVEGAIPS